MVSRNPEDLTEELEAIEFRGNAATLTVLRSEADETVDRQLDALADIDDKASRMLRLNVLLVGVVVSALSIASRLDVSLESGTPVIGQFRNIYVELAVASFVLSTALAAVTYTATEYDVGISAENAMELLGADLSTETVETLLVKNYVVRVNFNRSVNIRNIPLVTATIVFAVTGVILFTLGTYQAIVGPVSWWLLAGAMALIVAVVVVSGLPTQTYRAWLDIREWHRRAANDYM